MSAGKSVLVVDDSHDLPALLGRAFRRVCGRSAVYPMPNGERALEHLLQCGERIRLPDLVLLDRVMPGGMDGFETLRALRAVERFRTLPILMFSGSDDEEHVAQARADGADGYLCKPSAQTELTALARQVTSWRPEESWRSYGGTASGLELLQAAREVGSGPSILAAMTHAAAPLPAADQTFAAQAGDFFRFVMDLAGRQVDPVEAAINAACRKRHIPVRHAKGTSKDSVTVQNRHDVLMDLMSEGFSDLTILENFLISKRQVERVRGEWREKRGGVVAVREQ